MEKQPFFRAAMAGLGKYHMGGYGRIGVYRVKMFHETFHFVPFAMSKERFSSKIASISPVWLPWKLKFIRSL